MGILNILNTQIAVVVELIPSVMIISVGDEIKAFVYTKVILVLVIL